MGTSRLAAIGGRAQPANNRRADHQRDQNPHHLRDARAGVFALRFW